MSFRVTNEDIEKLIKIEYDNAVENWGKSYNSKFEFYGILKEEVEEAEDMNLTLKQLLSDIWNSVKINDNDYITFNVENIRETAINNIKELLQVCAVCDKYFNK